MFRFMLDTNICIYAMRGRHMNLHGRLEANYGGLVISSVVFAELIFGVEKSDRRDANLAALEVFAKTMEVLPFDRAAAMHYGEIRAELERAGTPCGQADIQIGAHARSLGLTLVTNNRREFDRMPGLKVENWV